VQGTDARPVHAVESFDYTLQPRRYCMTCMTTFSSGEPVCPRSGVDCKLVEVKRRIHGWVGLQRYMHEEDFGVDLIRNGRVIEVRNKDLFIWNGGDRPEREYPIDDQRNRGRFIGEIHMDHCRVSYTKDRFERDDPAWAEMVNMMRGEGPLQPQKARGLGFAPQDAPLYRLFQAFRRSSPQGKTGRWTRILAVKNNERAIEMADLFDKGDPDYQTDEKWYELVEEEDRAIVGAAPNPTSPSPAPPEMPDGFLDDGDLAGVPALPDQLAPAPAPPQRQKIHELSRVYKHPLLKVEFNVEAFLVEPGDPDLPPRAPWMVRIDDPATRTFLYLVQPDHNIFQSSTMTPLDGLLSELALKTHDFLKDTRPNDALFSAILSEFRSEYATETQLDSREIIAQAEAALREIALSIAPSVASGAAQRLFDEMSDHHRELIRRKVAASGASAVQTVVANGEFLVYADADGVRCFVGAHPELFFDGRFWEQPHATLDYGSDKVNVEARRRVLERFDNYLADAAWLTSQSPRDLDRNDRDAVIRATLSLRLLRPDRAT
jgi:hypothetical protein